MKFILCVHTDVTHQVFCLLKWAIYLISFALVDWDMEVLIYVYNIHAGISDQRKTSSFVSLKVSKSFRSLDTCTKSWPVSPETEYCQGKQRGKESLCAWKLSILSRTRCSWSDVDLMLEAIRTFSLTLYMGNFLRKRSSWKEAMLQLVALVYAQTLPAPVS